MGPLQKERFMFKVSENAKTSFFVKSNVVAFVRVTNELEELFRHRWSRLDTGLVWFPLYERKEELRSTYYLWNLSQTTSRTTLYPLHFAHIITTLILCTLLQLQTVEMEK